jgi:hypothetical protein
MQANGTFEVNLQPLDPYAKGGEGVGLGRMSIDKNFYGDLEAASQGEMLTAMTAVQGSAGYVAIEQVSGTLHGKSGSFVLQHYGKATIDQNSLILQVVPNSATGQLQGLSGDMTIDIKDGQHHYTFEYTLST